MIRRRRRQNAPAIGFDALRGLSAAQWAEKLAGPSEDVAQWLRSAARFGMVEAQTAFGQILLDGQGVARDRQAAVRWFRSAADAGHPPALNMLGRCCELGWGVAVDWTCAADCYRKAAEAGLDWGRYNLANMLLRGRGVATDRKAALALYQLAAERGHAKSLNMVGRFVEEGWEVPANRHAAADFYRRSAEGGDFRGQYNFASFLAATGDISSAEVWLLRAMDGATAEFLAVMSDRLAKSVDAKLRRIGTMALARSARLAINHPG